MVNVEVFGAFILFIIGGEARFEGLAGANDVIVVKELIPLEFWEARGALLRLQIWTMLLWCHWVLVWIMMCSLMICDWMDERLLILLFH